MSTKQKLFIVHIGELYLSGFFSALFISIFYKVEFSSGFFVFAALGAFAAIGAVASFGFESFPEKAVSVSSADKGDKLPFAILCTEVDGDGDWFKYCPLKPGSDRHLHRESSPEWKTITVFCAGGVDLLFPEEAKGKCND